MAERLLDVKNLKTYFFTDEGVVRAVDGVDLYIDKGETLGVVGESGCGKSVTALSIMKLIPQPPGQDRRGRDPLQRRRPRRPCPPNQMRKIRGKEISMIFQEPMTSLNPVFTCGEQIAEALRLHEGLGRRDGHGQDGRDAEARAHPQRRAPGQGVPAPALGRHAPARHDRHGAVLQSRSS